MKTDYKRPLNEIKAFLMSISGIKPKERVGKISRQTAGDYSGRFARYSPGFAFGMGVSLIKYSGFILLLFLVSCCWKSPDILKEEVKDVTEIRQDHSYHINYSSREKHVLPEEDQLAMNENYNKTYFSVWHNLQPVHSSSEKIALVFKKFALNPGYGENKKRHSMAWLKKLEQNAALENYPNTLQPAITTRNTNLRMLPTQGPHFYSSDGDIAGWPFDNLQISSVPASTPVLICHLSADKSWALVETNFAFGWMPVEDYALVDDNFLKKWETGRYAVVIQDKTSVFDAEGHFILRTSIGQMFPLVGEITDKSEIFIAAADENNHAIVKHGFVSPQIIALKPLPFTYANAVKIANELIDEPYGWGGLYGNRDCSAMTRDFFAPFGVWLPRHSEDQVKKVGTYVDLQKLAPEQKEKIILEQGIPYLSLLWRKGHVMIYIGEENGRALIFHNVWGLKTVDFKGREGRKIIGKAVITTLCPGAELYCLVPQESLLINTISAMTILAPVAQNQQKQPSETSPPAATQNSGS
jgi:cell wall-associated NlpC family hydrolase